MTTSLKSLALVAALGCALAGNAMAATTLKWATAAPEKSVWGAQISKFAAAVENHSGGELKLEVFWGSALGTDADNIRQLQRGRLDAGSFTAAVLPTVEPATAVLAMPYAWSGMKELSCVLEGPTKAELATLLDAQGMHLVGWSLVGEMGFSSLEPVKSIADLAGASIRSIPSKASTDFWSAAGLVPQTIPPSDIAPALSTKRISAAEGSMVFYVVTGENKVAPHWTQAKHIYIPATFLVSKKVYNGLSDKQKMALEKAMEEVSLPWFTAALNGFMERVKQMQAGAGGTYSELSAEDTKTLRAHALATRPAALEALGDGAKALWAKIETAKGACAQ
ncbi:MAG: TRAP transporter substrate-binding protein DctP [Pseudomonadota bacterium]